MAEYEKLVTMIINTSGVKVFAFYESVYWRSLRIQEMSYRDAHYSAVSNMWSLNTEDNV